MDAELIFAIASGGEPPLLVTVLEIKGSAPRHAGSKMLVRPGRPLLGTVGGGRLEASAISSAEVCAKERNSRLIEVEMLGEAALGSDMICGGSSLMLIERAAESAPYKAAKKLLELGKRALFVKLIEARPGAVDCSVGVVVLDENLIAVSGSKAALDDSVARKALASGKPIFVEERKLFYDPVFPEEKLVILGGGHVALALARLAAGLDFSVTVVDDRPEMADPGRFPPGVKTLLSGYAAAVQRLPFDAATYAVVLTRGHVYDLESARAILGREYRYAGMIGSARKTRLIFEQLKAEGIDPAKIDAFCAPIGLDIEAETPEEIAICILGEMIAVRRNAKSLPAMAAARAARRA